jgi:NAD(P)-dependent dehydrogenase (short-subunit alcohol dehydrogenase family)
LTYDSSEVSKKETAVKVVEAALKHFGRIDLLVNNAGIFIPKAVGDRTRCHCCLTSTLSATLPLVTRMFLLGQKGSAARAGQGDIPLGARRERESDLADRGPAWETSAASI